MKRFVLLFLFWILFLFTFLYADTSVVSRIINNTQTQLTLILLKPFLQSNQLNGIDIIINPYYKIIITQACNGMIPVLFLFAAIFAYPSKLLYKLLWGIAGYVVYTIVNIARILIVVYFVTGEEGDKNFFWSHDLLGNALLISLGLLLFIAFIKTSKSR